MKKTILTALLLFAAAAVFAQSEYNFQRRSLFEKLPVTSKDIVFLGNSITDGGEWNELLANPRVKNRGISGDRSSWMLDRLDPIVGGQPRKLFLLIGTNDLAAGTPAAEVVANVRKIVERFQSESPRTKLYVQSVFPVNDSFKKYAAKHGRHDADIVAVNKGLQALCAEKGIVYIDLWTLLADKNGKLRADLTNDGLHLMGEGYIVLARRGAALCEIERSARPETERERLHAGAPFYAIPRLLHPLHPFDGFARGERFGFEIGVAQRDDAQHAAPLGNRQEGAQVVDGLLAVGLFLAAGTAVDMHPARFQTGVDERELQDRSRDGRIVDP